MTIQGAQEYSREHGLTTCRTGNIVMIDADCYAPICVIEAALDNGYQLCKVDEIIKELEDRKEESDLNEVAGLIYERVYESCIKIIKEACR